MTHDELFVLAVNSASSILSAQRIDSKAIEESNEFEKLVIELHAQILRAAQVISDENFCELPPKK